MLIHNKYNIKNAIKNFEILLKFELSLFIITTIH